MIVEVECASGILDQNMLKHTKEFLLDQMLYK